MKINGYTWVLFLIPFFADLIFKGANYDVNFSLLIIAVSASVVGSTAFIAKKYENERAKFKNIFAIYSTGFFLSYLMFDLAAHYRSMSIAGGGSALVSYFSIEVILLVSSVIRGLPSVILRIIESWGKK